MTCMHVINNLMNKFADLTLQVTLYTLGNILVVNPISIHQYQIPESAQGSKFPRADKCTVHEWNILRDVALDPKSLLEDQHLLAGSVDRALARFVGADVDAFGVVAELLHPPLQNPASDFHGFVCLQKHVPASRAPKPPSVKPSRSKIADHVQISRQS